MQYKLKNMSWSEFDERRKTAKTVIIPAGACEVYGRHLPLGSDIIVAEKIAELVAAEVNGIVAPCVDVGQSKVLADYPGTIAISAEALCAVYKDIVDAFIKWGFKNFFLLNTHLHNTVPLCEVLEDARQAHGIKYAHIGWWQYIPSISADVFEHATPHTHASEAGTSVLMHLVPELVDMSKADNTANMFTDTTPNIGKGEPYGAYTNTGTLGDATLGTAEKGRIVVERGVAQIAQCIREYLEK